jgi:PAS domain S-box-containing protein
MTRPNRAPSPSKSPAPAKRTAKQDALTNAELIDRIARLRTRLDEAEQTLEAIRNGHVDALVVAGPQGDLIFSLTGAEQVYRFITEAMNEGALTMDLGGYILFCNRRFSDMVKTPIEAVLGQRLTHFAAPPQQPVLRALVAEAQAGPVRRRAVLQAAGGTPISVQLSANLLVAATPPCICMVITDLTELEVSANSIQVLREQQQVIEASQAELRRQGDWLRVTLSSIGDAVIAADNERRVSFINPMAAALTGCTGWEALGKPVQDVFRIVDETTGRPAEDIVARVLSEGRTVHMGGPILLLARDGRRIPIEDSAAPIKDSDGLVSGVVLVFQDVIEKRRRMEELAAARDRLAADLGRMSLLHEISTRLVGQGDLASLLDEIVRAAMKITGADMGSIQLLDESGALKIAAHSGFTQSFLDFCDSLHRESPSACGQALAGCRRTIVEDVTHNTLFRDAPALDTLLAADVRAFQSTPLVSRAGRIVGMFSTHYRSPRQIEEADMRLLDLLARQVADLIERMQVNEALNNRTKQLEAANRELESFSYSVSHDLQAPLRAIDGFTRMILRKHAERFDEDALAKFNVIRDNAQMMGRLIDDLLAFSRLDKAPLSVARLEMDVMIREVWEEIEAANPDRRLTLKISTMPPGRGDRGLIRQVLVNLLSNAVKFTRGRPEALIEADGYLKDGESVYRIRDNGVGFDMLYHDKMFGVFQRLHSSAEFEGTGVGLAIVQRIIHRHGGRIWAEGRVNEGATFYMTLPPETTDFMKA